MAQPSSGTWSLGTFAFVIRPLQMIPRLLFSLNHSSLLPKLTRRESTRFTQNSRFVIEPAIDLRRQVSCLPYSTAPMTLDRLPVFWSLNSDWNHTSTRIYIDPFQVLTLFLFCRLFQAFALTMIRFDNLPPEVMQAMCTPMHLIIPAAPSNSPRPPTGSLWLGSLSATMDKSVLHQQKITHVVQVLDVPWLPISEADGFECYKIDILDVPSADLRGHLEGACKDIDKALRSGKNTLVHCQQVNYFIFTIGSSPDLLVSLSRAYLAVPLLLLATSSGFTV